MSRLCHADEVLLYYNNLIEVNCRNAWKGYGQLHVLTNLHSNEFVIDWESEIPNFIVWMKERWEMIIEFNKISKKREELTN